jgi:hypothetical protein
MLSVLIASSYIMLDTGEVLKLSDSYELYSPKMSAFFEAMGGYEIVVMAIDETQLMATKELLTSQLAQQQGLLIVIYAVSYTIFSKITKLKTPHDI